MDKSTVTTFRLLWDEAPTGTRPTLNVDRIVETAITIADTEGMKAASMQRVATELGYTAMALYRHIPGKTELVTLMADTAHGPPPDPSHNDWRADIELWANALWDVFRRHPWMLHLETTTAPTGPKALAWFEALLHPLAQTSLTPDETVAAAMFISSSVRDLARVSTELVPTGTGYGDLLAEVLDPERFPRVTALMATGTLQDDGDVRPVVTFGLHRFLDGLEAHTQPH